MKKSKAPLGASLIVISSFFYASYGIWTKLLGDLLGGYAASTIRSALVVLMLLPPALLYRQLEPLRLKQNWKCIAGIFVGALFTWGPLFYSIQHVGIGISLTINYASMVIGLFFFGWLFAGERFTRDKALSAVLGLFGIGLIFSPSASTFSNLGLILAFVSGVSIALTTVSAKKLTYNTTQSTLVLWSVAIFANLIMMFIVREPRPALVWDSAWLYLVLFAVASVIASWLLLRGLKLIDAGAAGILGLLEIVFGVLFGVLFFHERPSKMVLLGVAVIIAAAAIPYFKDYNAKRGTLD